MKNIERPSGSASELPMAYTDETFARLAVHYGPLIRRQAARLQNPSLDHEDLEQEGLLGLLSAMRTFREEGGASFDTYAYTCIRRRMISALRRLPPETPLSLDENDEPDEEALPAQDADPAQVVLAHDDEVELDRRLRSLLTPLEYEVLRCHMDGYSYRETAKALQIGEKAVDNALQRIRRKLSPT